MTRNNLKTAIEGVQQKFANTIALGIMGNVPGAEGTPIYTKPEEATTAIMAAVDEYTRERQLEVIGADGEYSNDTPLEIITQINTENQLRAEQRASLKEIE